MGIYDPIEPPVTCCIRVLRDGVWYDQRPLECPVAHSRKVIDRLLRKGRTIKYIWFSGMGLGIGD